MWQDRERERERKYKLQEIQQKYCGCEVWTKKFKQIPCFSASWVNMQIQIQQQKKDLIENKMIIKPNMTTSQLAQPAETTKLMAPLQSRDVDLCFVFRL